MLYIKSLCNKGDIQKIKTALIKVYFLHLLLLVLNVFLANIERSFINNVLGLGDEKILWRICLVLSCIYFLSFLANVFLTLQKQKTHMFYSSTNLRRALCGALSIPQSKLATYNPDDIKMRIETDSITVASIQEKTYLIFIPAMVEILLYSILILVEQPLLGMLLLLSSIFIHLYGSRISKQMDKDNIEIRKANNQANNQMYVDLSNYASLKSKNLQEYSCDVFAANQSNIRNKYFDWMTSFIKFTVFQTIKTDFFLKVFVYMAAAISVLQGKISVGTVVLLLSSYTSVNTQLSSVIDFVVETNSTKNNYERYRALIKQTCFSSDETVEMGSFQSLDLKGISYAYESQKGNILDSIDMTISRGDKIIILGGSGSGKSTLVKCLARILIPQNGTIFYNGVNISTISNYNNQISFIMQDSALFNLSIWDNLVLGNNEISLTNVKDLCQRMRIYEDILKMEDGFNTIIEKDGNLLSGGQRQKLCIVRALLQHPEILILDESNSALDEETEATVNIELLQDPDKTILFVSHRDSTNNLYPLQYEMFKGKLIRVNR